MRCFVPKKITPIFGLTTIKYLPSTFTHPLMKAFFLSKVLPAVVMAFAFSSLALAQGPPGGGVEPLDPTPVPIDGGASLLLASGVAFGIQKLRNRRRTA